MSRPVSRSGADARKRVATTRATIVAGVALTTLVGMWALSARALSGVGTFDEAFRYCAVVGAVFAGAALAVATQRWRAALAALVGVLTMVSTIAWGGLDYANADAALAVQAAGFVAVVLVRMGLRRIVVAAVILPLLALTLLAASRTGAVAGSLVLAAVVAPTLSHPRLRRVTIGSGLLLASLAAGQAVVVWFRLQPQGLVETLSEARFNLWTDAITMISERPVLGNGPGAFSLLSPTAQDNPFLRPGHSATLEATADLGLVGLGLLAAVVAAGYLALTTWPSRASAVGVAAWTGLWLHSLVDYVADYPAVMLVAGMTVGATIGPRGSRRARPHPSA